LPTTSRHLCHRFKSKFRRKRYKKKVCKLNISKKDTLESYRQHSNPPPATIKSFASTELPVTLGRTRNNGARRRNAGGTTFARNSTLCHSSKHEIGQNDTKTVVKRTFLHVSSKTVHSTVFGGEFGST